MKLEILQTRAFLALVILALAIAPVTAQTVPPGFNPSGLYGTPISVTNSSASSLLPSGTSVVVYNTGGNVAYVNFGASAAVAATTAHNAIPAGGGCGFYVLPNTWIAAITASSTTTLNVAAGGGTLPGCWGGGSSGGAASNVTVVGPLGTQTPAASVAVTISPATATYTEATLTGATDTTICGGITPISGFEIINNSTSELLYFRENGVAAVAGASSSPIQQSAAYDSPAGYKPTGIVHVIATTTGHAVIERCW